MTRTIHKYRIEAFENALKMPAGAQILTVHSQDSRVYIWALIDKNSPIVKQRTILMVATGDIIPEQFAGAKYIDTVFMLNGLVFHAFDAFESDVGVQA